MRQPMVRSLLGFVLLLTMTTMAVAGPLQLLGIRGDGRSERRFGGGRASGRPGFFGGGGTSSADSLHLVNLGAGGMLECQGGHCTTVGHMRRILFECCRPDATPPVRGILIHMHGAMVNHGMASKKVSTYRELFLPHGIYPIIISWQTGFLPVLEQTREDQPGALVQTIAALSGSLLREGMDANDPRQVDLQRVVDRALPASGGRQFWEKMKENGIQATCSEQGGLSQLAALLAERLRQGPPLQVNLSCHSAGSVILGPFVARLTKGYGIPVATCTLRGAACTADFFAETYLPALSSGRLGSLAVFNLTEVCEETRGILGPGRSPLLLLDKGLEAQGAAIVGLHRDVVRNPLLSQLVRQGSIDYVLCPNNEPVGSPRASRADEHSRLGDDPVSLQACLARMLGAR